MEKATEIKITDTAKYNGQDMEWTEELEFKTADSDFDVFHCSDSYITEFLTKETCFFNEESLAIGHSYKLEIKKGQTYYTDGSEVRLEIKKTDKIEYLGEFELVGSGQFEKTYSNYEGWISREILKREGV